MGLQAQLDDLNSQLDVINERYADAQKQREDAVANVESIEEQLQTATGGTADALKSQLADAMHARQEADREEKRLAKEKEKREAEIAKKEKQMKRLELVSQIAQGIANTAAGVTKALGLVFPLNLVVAGIVGAMGAVQVGIMAKQLTKLAKGGEINGPSHDNGGVRIHGTNIEVEGGEYVVNKDTTRKNKGLVSFINSQRKALTADDINNFFNKPAQAYEGGIKTYLADGGEIPTIENNVSTSIDYEELADAMGNIKIEPKVAVTDIMDATDQVTTVRDLSGF
jgi:multidrug efflux pump subunit AcrA (membrane-fusion protein)